MTDPTKWGVTSLRLQRPENVYFQGRVRPWDEAVLHVSTEAVTRGLNVLEGVKGYWQPSGEFALRSPGRHYRRMLRSSALLHIPVDFSESEFIEACFALTRAELQTDSELYIRATLFVVEGHYGEGTVADLVLAAYQQVPAPPPPVDAGTSTWRRSPDLSMPARIKSGASYGIARLARIEGRSRNLDEMILLNQSGRVAEGIASCLLLVRNGVLATPPASEGALESITLDIITELAREEGITVVQRPIDRSELYVADELGLTSTLAEVTRIRSLDEQPLPEEAPVLDLLARRYRDAVTGVRPSPAVELSTVPLHPR